jgi:predicted phage terminase large subunit-like protein
VWRQARLELRNGSTIGALGTGGRIRGRRFRQARPSLVVFDDVESNDTIVSQAKREKAWRWVTREVIPVGDDRTNFLSVGSALHREAVAVKLGTLPGWSGRTFAAIHSWPDRMDFWAEWENRATNLTDLQRNATAEKFYTANRAAMDKGAKVYWPARWPLEVLMRRRAEIGHSAFLTEYQGVPSAEGLTEWPAEYFDDPSKWFDSWPDGLVWRVQALDPSKGAASKSGDYQAHVLVGFHCDGPLYVEATLHREPIPQMIARVLDLARLSGFGQLDSLVIENNDVLGTLFAAFDDELRRRNAVVPIVGIRNTRNKVGRIRTTLGLHFGRGQIRFRRTRGTQMLVDQLRDFPNAAFDDGPDAFELAMQRMSHLSNPR